MPQPDAQADPTRPTHGASGFARVLRHEVVFAGAGLFTGRPVSITIRPADRGSGICFLRTDDPAATPIRASVDHVVPRPRHTVLADGVSVATVEHVMAALASLHVADALVTLDAPEVPILDGSASEFARVLSDASAESTANAASACVRITRPHRIADEFGSIEAMPLNPGDCDALICEYHLDYGPGAPIPVQSATFTLRHDGSSSSEFIERIAPARTFCTLAEAQAMRAAGLFSHVRPGEMLVLGPDGPVDTALRFDNEPARHKVLDMLGDLALAGAPIIGRVVARKTGHAMNHAMARALKRTESPAASA